MLSRIICSERRGLRQPEPPSGAPSFGVSWQSPLTSAPLLPLINLSMPARLEQDVVGADAGDHAGLASPVMMLYLDLGVASFLNCGPRWSRSQASMLADTGDGHQGARRIGIVRPTSAATWPTIGYGSPLRVCRQLSAE